MQKQKHQAGFGVVEVIVIVTILVLVGIGGWYIWQAQQKTSQQDSVQQPSTSDPTPQQSALRMASDKVVFGLPAGWSASGKHVSTDCMRTIDSEITCLDQTTIYPNDVEMVDGVPRYSVTVAVYQRVGSVTAKDWWENAYKGDNGTTIVSGSIVEPTTSPVNGYNAYRFKLDRTYGDLSQSIVAAGEYIVLVSAVLDEPAPSTGGSAKDWTGYLPAIRNFVESVKIQ